MKMLRKEITACVLIFHLLIGITCAYSGPKTDCANDTPIWPIGSRVLSDGIKFLEEGKASVKNSLIQVSNPTYIVYSPRTNSCRTAIIVFPGGGYKTLGIGKDSTIGLNGAAVAQWLNEAGITCVLLKYRVPNSGCNWDEKAKKHVCPSIPLALQDAQRTISTIRYNARKYNLDQNKIGVMGFSAGGNLAVLSSTAFNKRSYEPIDEIDTVNCRPDFAIPVYPGHMTMEHKNVTPRQIAAEQLNTDIVVSKDIPATLLVHAEDDPIDPVHYSLVYEKELKKVGVKVKLNLYKTGGHAFGVSKSGKDTDRWTEDALAWLKETGML